jgi:hypothetical protein
MPLSQSFSRGTGGIHLYRCRAAFLLEIFGIDPYATLSNFHVLVFNGLG